MRVIDRTVAFTGQVPLTELNFLAPQRNTLVGVAKLSEAVLGTGASVDGLWVNPTGPPSLAVRVDPGQIYMNVALDATAYGALPADTQHLVVKQGVQLDPLTLAISPPGTAGFAQWFLVQVNFREADAGAVVLPYYNSADPSQAFAGPNNSGEQQYTERRGQVAVQLKPGAPAATGSHQRPAADPGWVGLAWVQAVNGASAIGQSDIVPVPDVPRIPMKMPSLAKAIGTSVTTVSASRQMLAEDAGLVIVDVGAFSGSITLRLPPANSLPGVPTRFRFIGRYATPSNRRSISFATVVPTGTDTLDLTAIYVGPEDSVEIVSDGASRWLWTGNRASAHGLALLSAAQTIPNDVATTVSFTGASALWSAAAPSQLTLPRTMRLRAQANVTWESNATGWRAAYLVINGTGRGDGLGRTVLPAVNGNETSFGVTGGPMGAIAGDALQLVVHQNSGGPLTIRPSTTWMALEWLA